MLESNTAPAAEEINDFPIGMRPRVTSERVLLSLAALFLLVSQVTLVAARSGIRAVDWMPFAVWLVCAAAGNILLDRRLPQRDPLLFPLAMLLSGWGLIMIERLAPNFADRQAVWVAISMAVGLVFALLPHPLRWLRTYRYVLLVGGLLLLGATILFGSNPSGLESAPQLWLGIGTVFFQPSETLKIILVSFLASYLGEHYPSMRASALTEGTRRVVFSPRIIGPILLMWGVSIVILVWQRDLGTAVLFFMVFLALLYVATGYTLILASGALLITAAGFVAYNLFSVVQLRVDIWLNPWPEADGRAFQIVQSLLAFAAGGIFGKGVGQGAPTYIPVVHSDFAFAALAEEWGFLGVVTVIVCIAALVMRGLRIAIYQRGKPFPTLLAVGLSTLLAAQSILIMSGVLKLVPLTGVTLPFLSYGGSSLLVSFIIIGLLLRLSSGEKI